VHIQALGHVVLKVSDLHRSEEFYSSLLGMRIHLAKFRPANDVLQPRNTRDPSRLRPHWARPACP